MDGQWFDAMAKAVADGSTRRRALRLAGGGLAGALLAAAGLGRRAGAQENVPEFTHCNSAEGGAVAVNPGTDEFALGLPCGGNADCPQDKICIAAVNPGNQLACRCVRL